MSNKNNKQVISLTDKAIERIRHLVQKSDKKIAGLRIGVKSSGCSGFKYSVEYADEPKQFEESISTKGVTIFIDPAAPDNSYSVRYRPGETKENLACRDGGRCKTCHQR